MTRLTRPHATVFRVDIIQFIQYNLCLVCPRHNVAARPCPLTEKMLMLNNIPQQYRPARMLQRENERMRTRPVELLDKTPLNPRLQTLPAEIEESSQQLRQCLSIRFLLGNIPVQPHHMPRITTPRHRNKMTRKILPVVPFLKTHTTTRTLRQFLPTTITENPSANDHEAA